MALPALVLVHGGAHAADCWDLTVDEINRLAPELDVLAVDLPGRRGKPGNLETDSTADWVRSAVADIEDAGFDEVVIVGHSLAGVTIPGVAAKLGSSRVRELIFATAFVPPEGTAVVDTLAGPLAWYARRGAKTRKTGELPAAVASFAFVNGVPRARRRYLLDRLYADSPCIATENVSRREMPDEIPRTWILTTRDRALSVRSQRNSIAALGGVQTMFPMDTCHDLMISEPKRLAEILVERCRAYR
ncbi:alpha/beta fold hydrolase [Mycobacterium sp. MMS18-G62]